MFEAVFSFRGRLGRMDYFVRRFLVSAAFALLFLVIGVTAYLTHALSSAQGGLSLVLVGLPLLGAYEWTGFALQARRLRDIGWEPTFVIPVWIGALALDRFVELGLPSLANPQSLVQPTLVGLGLDLALSACLLFWPSKPPPAIGRLGPWGPAMAEAEPAIASFGRRGL